VAADEGIEKPDECLAAWRQPGARLWLPIFLTLKAEAHAKVGNDRVAGVHHAGSEQKHLHRRDVSGN